VCRPPCGSPFSTNTFGKRKKGKRKGGRVTTNHSILPFSLHLGGKRREGKGRVGRKDTSEEEEEESMPFVPVHGQK